MTDSKDHMGDKLRQKEKADEDRYFSNQDAARLEKLRDGQEKSEFKAGHCPRDGASLVEQKLESVSVDVCPTCNGIWLDQGELETIESRVNEAWLSKWVRSVLGS
ncbi:MAG: hypothetical protein ACI8TX_000253 [Hyphomicrobiaceae bacterium]|jgi:hypothetical protein